MLDRRPARVTGRQVPPRHLRWGSGSGAIFQRATHRFCGRGLFFWGLRRSAAGAGGTDRGPGGRGAPTIDTHPVGCKQEHRHRPRETRSSAAQTTRAQRLRALTGNRPRPEKDAPLRISIPRAGAMLVRSAGRSAPAQVAPGAAPNQQHQTGGAQPRPPDPHQRKRKERHRGTADKDHALPGYA